MCALMTRNDLIMECKSYYVIIVHWFMLRALRGYQALQVTILLVVNYFFVKACLYSNDRFVDGRLVYYL